MKYLNGCERQQVREKVRAESKRDAEDIFTLQNRMPFKGRSEEKFGLASKTKCYFFCT